MIHLHITSWILGLVLFFAAYYLHTSGNAKASKIVHMILRVFYILIIVSGVTVVLGIYGMYAEYIIKGVSGLWVIASMEMILVRSRKGKPVRSFWIQLIIALVLVLLLGWRLPLGFLKMGV
ncbi:YisL family protein [Metabacillus sp. 113a]|uniref:YisL family protein n=1 Tax=Metabacillus sp. 113a TaxID=3404706 RepID=UPI003CEE3D37